MPQADLHTILEAARWAPSAYNIQPWRFIYAMRGDVNWDCFLGLLDPFNAAWARNASALVFIASNSMLMDPVTGATRPSPTHSFDAGAAWAQLALQATGLGYQAHAMAGLLFDEASRRLAVPNSYRVEIAVAVGREASPSVLPVALREREVPSSRLPLERIAFAGRFPAEPST